MNVVSGRVYTVSGGIKTTDQISAKLLLLGDEWVGWYVTTQASLTDRLSELGELSYNILTKKRFYREARMHLLSRQYEIINRALKKTPDSYAQIVAVGILFISPRQWWLATVGDTQFFQFHNQQLRPIMDRVDKIVKPFEIKLGNTFIQPTGGLFKRGDNFICTSQQVTEVINHKKLNTILENTSPEEFPQALMSEVLKRKKTGNSYVVRVMKK